jgi:hypothetical protein
LCLLLLQHLESVATLGVGTPGECSPSTCSAQPTQVPAWNWMQQLPCFAQGCQPSLPVYNSTHKMSSLWFQLVQYSLFACLAFSLLPSAM